MIRKSGNRSCGKTTLNWNSDGARVSNEALRIGWKKLIIVMAAPLCTGFTPLPAARGEAGLRSNPGEGALPRFRAWRKRPRTPNLSSHAAPGRERLGLGLVTRERLLVRDAWEFC